MSVTAQKDIDPGLCRCGHHKSRHKPDPVTDYRQEPCQVPGCGCGDYRRLTTKDAPRE